MNDLEDRICIVTGATSGIGEASAAALARRGAQIAIVCRSAQRGEETKARIEKQVGRACVRLFLADFERLADVRRVAGELSEALPQIDVLLNNAGVTMLNRTETPDGYETTFAVNHLAPFLLTNLLMPKLLARPGARIVNVASDAHQFGWLELDDLQSRKRYSSLRVYGGSKLANILFTNELARRVGARDMRIWSAHPGAVATRLGANNGGIAKLVLPILALFFKTPDQGAATSIRLCADADVKDANGTYFANRAPARLTKRAQDETLARELWSASEKLVGLAGGTEAIWR